jgi:hypothetical protein
MEIVSILRALRRHWLLLVPGFALSVFVGLSVLYDVSLKPPSMASRQTTGGVATGRELLTALDAPVFKLDPRANISSSLLSRAIMLSDLAATDGLRRDIARRSGIDVGELAILGPASGKPEIEVPIAVESTAAAALQHEPYFVKVTTGAQLPVISVQASAPDEAAAGRLVDAVRDAMRDAIADRTHGKAVVGMESLGPTTHRTIVNAPKKPVAVIAVVVLFSLWCAGVVLLSGLWRRLRTNRRHSGGGAGRTATVQPAPRLH